MKEEIESVFSLIQDYRDGVGGVTDAFIMNELKYLVNEAQQQVKSGDLADVGNCTYEDKRRYRKQGYMAAFTGREEFRKLADEQFDRLYDEIFTVNNGIVAN